jgi:hypothetical protein
MHVVGGEGVGQYLEADLPPTMSRYRCIYIYIYNKNVCVCVSLSDKEQCFWLIVTLNV